AAFCLPYPELTGHRRQHQSRGVAGRERKVEQGRFFFPQARLVRLEREVDREYGREEHQLTGQPADRAHGCEVMSSRRRWAVSVDSGCGSHARYYVLGSK